MMKDRHDHLLDRTLYLPGLFLRLLLLLDALKYLLNVSLHFFSLPKKKKNIFYIIYI